MSSLLNEPDEFPDVTWQVCPFMRSPLKGLFALAAIGGLSWGTAMAGDWPMAGLGVAIALIFLLHRFFFPSTHTIDRSGVTLFTLFGVKQLAWKEIEKVSHDARRVYVSPSTRASDRGLLLLLNGNLAEVLAAINAGREAVSRTESTSSDA